MESSGRVDELWEGLEDTRRAQPTESTVQDSLELTETEAATVEHSRVCAGSSVHIFWFLAWYLGVTPDSRSHSVSVSFAYPWHPFPPAGLSPRALFVPDLIVSFFYCAQ